MPSLRRFLALAVLGLAACRGGVRSPAQMAAVRAATSDAVPAPPPAAPAPARPPPATVPALVARIPCEYYQISDG